MARVVALSSQYKHHHLPQAMNGFKADYQRLFQLFQSRSRVTDTQNSTEVSVKSQPCTSAHEDESITRYEFTFGQFMKCFEQNNFGCIFFGHRSKNELRQFSDEVFEYILDNMSVYLPIELRIFSFYLLYALWSIQQRVFSFQLNIRIDSEAHSNIKHLIENCLSRNQFDILVIYRKLFLTGAFLFCQSIELKGPYYRHYLMKPEKSNVQVRIFF